MTIIVESALLTAVIFIGAVVIVQPLINKLKAWIDL